MLIFSVASQVGFNKLITNFKIIVGARGEGKKELERRRRERGKVRKMKGEEERKERSITHDNLHWLSS